MGRMYQQLMVAVRSEVWRGASASSEVPLLGPPWVKKMGHGGFWVFGSHTPRTEGGSYIGRGTVTCDQKLF
jgi:hypothetical protein